MPRPPHSSGPWWHRLWPTRRGPIPGKTRLALQRRDMQYFTGSAPDGTPQWSGSRRAAHTYSVEAEARAEMTRLRARGFDVALTLIPEMREGRDR